MSMESVSTAALFTGTFAFVMLFMETGYRLGRITHRRSKGEKESPVSTMEAAILGLVAFMLAFTFDSVSSRFQERKALVRQEANAIGTVYLRADILPEADRARTVNLLRVYAEQRLAAVLSRDDSQMSRMLADSERTQRELWKMAIANLRRDMNSEAGALYLEALNEVVDLHRLRLSIGLQTRVPSCIWFVFYTLIVLGMFGVGYQTSVSGSRRTLIGPLVALSFSLVVTLIAELDRAHSALIPVPQDAMRNLVERMPEAAESATVPAAPAP